MSTMSNEELVKQYQSGNSQAMAQLYLSLQRFIGKLAGKFKGIGDPDDLKQEGALGLMEAAKKFDAGRGVSFVNFCAPWIKAYMLRFIAQNRSVRLPVEYYSIVAKYRKLCNQFEIQQHRKPTDREAAQILGVPERRLRTIIYSGMETATISLDSPAYSDDENEATIENTISDGKDIAADFTEDQAHAEAAAKIWHEVNQLTPEQALVIRQQFKESKTLPEIAAENHMAYRDTCSLQQSGMRQLRKQKAMREIAEDYDIYSRSLKCGGFGTFSRSWTSSTERMALRLCDK